MAEYAYECPVCGERFVVERKITEPRDDIRCPKCNCDGCERVIEAAAFVLKGSGWGRDGYR